MEQTVADLARCAQRNYFGKYRGFVVNNKDPEKRGRLRLLVPSALGETETNWALPCLPFGGLKDQGFFAVPEVDARVWVEFEQGNLSLPIWIGVFWQDSGDIPEEADKEKPTTRVFKTPSGHVLQFDDEPGKEQIRLHHPKEAEFLIDKNGTISLTDAKGSSLTLDADAGEIVMKDANGNTLTMDPNGIVVEDSNGNKIELGSSGITVKAKEVVIEADKVLLGGKGGEAVMLGKTFLQEFSNHMHSSGMGPTGPPIVPVVGSIVLSSSVKTK